MDFPISPLTGSRRAFSRKVLQNSWLVASAKKRFSNSRCLKASCWSSPASSRGDSGAGVHHCRADEVALLHAVQQGIAEGGLAVLAAEGAVGVEEEAALELAGIADVVAGWVDFLEVVAGRGGKAELIADEIIEDGASVAADGAVGLVGYHEVEIGR